MLCIFNHTALHCHCGSSAASIAVAPTGGYLTRTSMHTLSADEEEEVMPTAGVRRRGGAGMLRTGTGSQQVASKGVSVPQCAALRWERGGCVACMQGLLPTGRHVCAVGCATGHKSPVPAIGNCVRPGLLLQGWGDLR